MNSRLSGQCSDASTYRLLEEALTLFHTFLMATAKTVFSVFHEQVALICHGFNFEDMWKYFCTKN